MAERYIPRTLTSRLPGPDERTLTLVTGARQTGKTTMVRRYHPTLPYYNLDAPEVRAELAAAPTASWGKTVGPAILDEAQKEPRLFEKLKYAYDARDLPYSIMLGSSQILLLSRIKESLTGRVLIYELWPLMLKELLDEKEPPLFTVLAAGPDADTILSEHPPLYLGDQAARIRENEAYLLQWGGMPALLHLPENRRSDWLHTYNFTYLERDLADLAYLHNLSPFRKFHLLAAARAGGLLSYSELARDAGVSVNTARHYLEYLRLSYQAFLIQPYARNLTSTVVKTPKLYWSDLGLWRDLTGNNGPMSGLMFENHLIAEMLKYIRTVNPAIKLWFYRTRSGLEIDILLETQAGILGIEIKNRDTVEQKDTTPLRKVGAVLGERWLGGIVAYRGDQIRKLEPGIWAVPSSRLLLP